MTAIRTSRTLAVRMVEGRLVGLNELVGIPRRLSSQLLDALGAYLDWLPIDIVREDLRRFTIDDEQLDVFFHALVNEGFVIERGSQLHREEDQYRLGWRWGLSTGAHHLATRRLQFLDEAAEVERFAALIKTTGAPQLWTDPTTAATPLPRPLTSSVTAGLLGGRRTYREFSGHEIDLQSIAEVLWAGLGIQGLQHLPGRPAFPQRYAPSAGGLNAVSGYVIARHVTGLQSMHAFKYHGMSHALDICAGPALPEAELGRLFFEQSWAESASAFIVLVADYKQLSWKYSDASGYNGLLLEAGHIGQCLAIAATELGLGTVPTNAIRPELVEPLLGLQFPDQAAIYAMALGKPASAEAYGDYSAQNVDRFMEIVDTP